MTLGLYSTKHGGDYVVARKARNARRPLNTRQHVLGSDCSHSVQSVSHSVPSVSSAQLILSWLNSIQFSSFRACPPTCVGVGVGVGVGECESERECVCERESVIESERTQACTQSMQGVWDHHAQSNGTADGCCNPRTYHTSARAFTPVHSKCHEHLGTPCTLTHSLHKRTNTRKRVRMHARKRARSRYERTRMYYLRPKTHVAGALPIPNFSKNRQSGVESFPLRSELSNDMRFA